MERNKSDRANNAASSAKEHRTSFALPKQLQSQGNPMQDSMFMKYASSIIQVVSQERLQKSNQFRPNGETPDPIIEISDVMRYGDDPPAAHSQYQLTQSNNYNTLAQHFKKKDKVKQTFSYSFTNLTTLITVLAKLMARRTKQTLEILKNSQNKRQQSQKPTKIRTSFHSGTTASTHNEQFRSRRQLETIKKIEAQEQMREGANAIKGWIQFKILMIQNWVLREMMQYSKHHHYHELSPIASSKRDGLIENFYLSEYQQENSMSLAPHVHNIEESLAYTADQNFEFSRKENTITTPQKLSQEDGPNYYGIKSRARQVRNPSSEGKESLVEEYKPKSKAGSIFSSKVGELPKLCTTVSKPIELKINTQRRYLAIRTNLFELPIMSQIDLRKDGVSVSASMPLKSDHFNAAESELSCDNVEHITNLFETSNLLRLSSRGSAALDKSQSQQSYKSSANSYFASVRQKYSKVVVESKSSENFMQSCKIKSVIPQRNNDYEQQGKNSLQQAMGVVQDRMAPLKIQNYYFPGRSSRDTYKESHDNEVINELASKNRLDQVKQVDSILSGYQNKEISKNQPLMDESVVNTFAIAEDAKVKTIRGTAFPIRTDRVPTHMQEYSQLQERQRSREQAYGLDLRNTPKINIQMAPTIKKIEKSPGQAQIHHQGILHKRQEQVCSPQSNLRKNPYSPSPPPRPLNQQYAMPVQHQYGSSKRIEPIGRPQSRDRPMQKVSFNNVYQLNKQANQHVRAPSNTNNAATNSYGSKLQPGQQVNRPNSRVFSPQPMPPQYQHAYAMPSYRQQIADNKKNGFLSPQARQDQYFMQSNVKFSHYPDRRNPQLTSAIAEPVHDYFVTDLQGRPNQKAVNFNNKYYTSGVVDRQAQIATERGLMRPRPDERKKSRVQNDRPHSSSRQSFDRPNIFSNYSPMESELEGPNGSNRLGSRSNSKIGRPKSMNEKIHLTLRRER